MECQEMAPSAWAGMRERELRAGPPGQEALWPDAALWERGGLVLGVSGQGLRAQLKRDPGRGRRAAQRSGSRAPASAA